MPGRGVFSIRIPAVQCHSCLSGSSPVHGRVPAWPLVRPSQPDLHFGDNHLRLVERICHAPLLTMRWLVSVHPCVPLQAATPVDAGVTPPVPASPLQYEAPGAHDRNPVATRIHPSLMAGPAFRRQASEIGAGWSTDHVRICAGGTQQCAFLPQLGSSGDGSLDPERGSQDPWPETGLACLSAHIRTPHLLVLPNRMVRLSCRWSADSPPGREAGGAERRQAASVAERPFRELVVDTPRLPSERAGRRR